MYFRALLIILFFASCSAFEQKTPEENYTLAQSLEEAEQYEEAFARYRKAALKGHPWAQLRMGRIHITGTVTAKDGSTRVLFERDLVASEKWLRQAAAQFEEMAQEGNLDAMMELGHFHFEGLGGYKQDKEKAYQIWSEAADQGHPVAQYVYGFMLWSQEKNNPKAIDLLHKAAAQNQSDAQYLLFVIYRTDKGGETNQEIALEWLRKAAANGNKWAVKEWAKAEALGLTSSS